VRGAPTIRNLSRRFGRAILLAVAALYFLIDLIFLSVLRPLRRRITALPWIKRLAARVEKLNRYGALVLLLIPWLLLEPIKPLGVLLFTRKHHFDAVLLIGSSEIVKLTLFEQLFAMTRPKLMTFGWFAWSYGKWRAALDHLRSLPVWRRLRGWCVTARTWAIRWVAR
jgi:hypothetical protein